MTVIDLLKRGSAVILFIFLLYFPYQYFQEITVNTEIVRIEQEHSKEIKKIKKGEQEGVVERVPTYWGYGYLVYNDKTNKLLDDKNNILKKYILPMTVVLYLWSVKYNLEYITCYYDLKKKHLMEQPKINEMNEMN